MSVSLKEVMENYLGEIFPPLKFLSLHCQLGFSSTYSLIPVSIFIYNMKITLVERNHGYDNWKVRHLYIL